MKFNSIKLFTLIVAIAKVSGEGYKCGKHVIVQEGEGCSKYIESNTLPSIREKDLYIYNPTLDCDNLTAGTKVCLDADIDEYYENMNSHVIGKKDTLKSLATKLKTSETIIRRINNPIFEDFKDDELLDIIAGEEILYRKDNNYVPDFSESEDARVTSSNSVENDSTNSVVNKVVNKALLDSENKPSDSAENNSSDSVENNPSNSVEDQPSEATENESSEATENEPSEAAKDKPSDSDENKLSNSVENSSSNSVEDKSSDSNENNKGYKCDKHIVVPEGGKCSDFTYKFDIPYIRHKDLLLFNPTINCDQLTPGTKICLEPNNYHEFFTYYYTEEGDTLESISKKLNVDQTILKNLNTPIFDKEGSKISGVEVRYSKNGVYVPDFDNSNEVKSSNSNNVNN